MANHTSMIDFVILEQMTAFAVIMQKHPGWVGKVFKATNMLVLFTCSIYSKILFGTCFLQCLDNILFCFLFLSEIWCLMGILPFFFFFKSAPFLTGTRNKKWWEGVNEPKCSRERKSVMDGLFMWVYRVNMGKIVFGSPESVHLRKWVRQYKKFPK